MRSLTGLAALRIRVFHDWPYLYAGDLGYERGYLAVYRDNPRAIVAAAFDGDRLVGAATGLPMVDADPEFRAAFEGTDHNPEQIFYCAEVGAAARLPGAGGGPPLFRPARAARARFGPAFCRVLQCETARGPPRTAPWLPPAGWVLAQNAVMRRCRAWWPNSHGAILAMRRTPRNPCKSGCARYETCRCRLPAGFSDRLECVYRKAGRLGCNGCGHRGGTVGVSPNMGRWSWPVWAGPRLPPIWTPRCKR